MAIWSGQISSMETFKSDRKQLRLLLDLQLWSLQAHTHVCVYMNKYTTHTFTLVNSFFMVSEAGKLTIEAQASDNNLYVV